MLGIARNRKKHNATAKRLSLTKMKISLEGTMEIKVPAVIT